MNAQNGSADFTEKPARNRNYRQAILLAMPKSEQTKAYLTNSAAKASSARERNKLRRIPLSSRFAALAAVSIHSRLASSAIRRNSADKSMFCTKRWSSRPQQKKIFQQAHQCPDQPGHFFLALGAGSIALGQSEERRGIGGRGPQQDQGVLPARQIDFERKTKCPPSCTFGKSRHQRPLRRLPIAPCAQPAAPRSRSSAARLDERGWCGTESSAATLPDSRPAGECWRIRVAPQAPSAANSPPPS